MKRKRQPTAEVMRQQLALAADEIIRLKTEAAQRDHDNNPRPEYMGGYMVPPHLNRDASNRVVEYCPSPAGSLRWKREQRDYNEQMSEAVEALSRPAPRVSWWRRLLVVFR
jgi:hypothetical protein